MYITLYPSPSAIPLCSLSSFGLKPLQSVRFAAWGIARSCPFTADLQKKICHYSSQTRTGNSISHEIQNVTTDIRCLYWEQKARDAGGGNNQFPPVVLALACCWWKFSRVRCKSSAVVVCWKGVQRFREGRYPTTPCVLKDGDKS